MKGGIMPQTYCDLARELKIPENQLSKIIQRAGISCDSEFNGNFIWLTDELNNYQRSRIFLHTNSFGDLPVIGLPDVNMLEKYYQEKEIINGYGLDTIYHSLIKGVIPINKSALSSPEIFSLAYFLGCIWVDIKQETYRHRYVFWNPTISFDTPVYYRSGELKEWSPECNFIRASIWEILDSIYRFLIWSFIDYTYNGVRHIQTKFPMTLSTKEDILKMPGVACLNTPDCKRVAFNMLTLIRSLTAQMCCMLLRRGNDAFVVKPTTEATLADDIKQFYLLIQKMEAFINNG